MAHINHKNINKVFSKIFHLPGTSSVKLPNSLFC